ncbi:MAG: energy transducer TonB [Bacteroidia bacterium]
MTKPIIAFILLLSLSCQKKVVHDLPIIKYEQKVNYSVVMGSIDKPAQYPEPDRWAMYHYGLKGINQDINRVLKFPQKALSQKLEGMVLVRFVVETDGYIYKTEVINSTNAIFEPSAQEAIKNLKQWIPALINNKPVASLYKLPVYFALTN